MIERLSDFSLRTIPFTSICYILDETDPEGKALPLFEIQLHLETSDLVFHPSVMLEDENGFYIFYEGLMFDIMKMGTLIPRIDLEKVTERENYGVSHFFLFFLLALEFFTFFIPCVALRLI